MKLVIFGLTVTSSCGNGHATLWRGLCAALAAQGHDVVFFERDVPWYAGDHRDLEHCVHDLIAALEDPPPAPARTAASPAAFVEI